MRLTITQKIIAGIATVVVVAIVALLLASDGLSRVVVAMRELAEVREPQYSATLEVELNVNGSVMAAFAYLDAPDPRHRRRVEKDHRDIAEFLGKFAGLAETDGDRRLAARLEELSAELRRLTDVLLATRDRQAMAWSAIMADFERADSIIDRHLQPRVERNAPLDAAMLSALADLESDLAEVGVWLGNYHRMRQSGARAQIEANAEEFRETLRRLRSPPLQQGEARQAEELSRVFGRMADAIPPTLELQDSLRTQSDRLLGLRDRIDQLLDDEIQRAALREMYEPRRTAEEIASVVLQRTRWLSLLVLLAAAATAVALIRSIGRPVRLLKAGATAVGRGDLRHRISLAGEDELAELGAEFNRMVEQLQMTTVSKELLERSERTLQETVAQLREEIAERAYAEAERSRLELSLRRTETMAAMGALVGGVAHEVRNPLFGILSILEAMDARFGTRPEHRRHVEMLREQAQRLNRLMRDLLEYGKPPSHQFAPGSVAEVLNEALTCVRASAEGAGVRLISRIAVDSHPRMLDHNRLLQVFINLIENAIQHSPAGGAVMLESRVVDQEGLAWMEVTVADEGSGIAAEDLPHVFQPFYTRRHGGTGLGLSIVQRVVEEHGGEVTAANQPNGGAILAVRLPALDGVLPPTKETHATS